MGHGVDWSLADVQFVRDGMAGGANEKLLRRLKQGESGSRKQRASRVHADVVDRMEEDIQTNPRQSWADLAVKYECSRYTIRRVLTSHKHTTKHSNTHTTKHSVTTSHAGLQGR